MPILLFNLKKSNQYQKNKDIDSISFLGNILIILSYIIFHILFILTYEKTI